MLKKANVNSQNLVAHIRHTDQSAAKNEVSTEEQIATVNLNQ